MDRIVLKQQAKNLLNKNFIFFLLMSLPSLVFSFIEMIADNRNNLRFDYVSTYFDINLNSFSFISMISALIASLLSVSFLSANIDILRNESKLEKPLQKSLNIFDRGDYFIGLLVISILQGIFVLLWMFLFFVPGVIKSLSYSQAFYIYRDHIKKGEKIGFLQAITESRQLMNGHKWEYFVLLLSFIGWILLSFVTFGLAAFWVFPYISITLANYYVNLAK